MQSSVVRQIAGLEKLSLEELRGRWQELNGTEPPAYRRDVMIKRLAYRIQELAFGGVSEATRSRLRDHLAHVDGEAKASGAARLSRRRANSDHPAAGTMLVRIWHGNRYEVTAVAGGFEYEGRKYRSLTAIAKAITGAHWNGRVFFGLSKRNSKS